jgi:ABC-type glycerol-3-phosphate transport system substrate-binding protein
MTKKAIGLLLALGMVASLTACGGGETAPPAGGESPAASPAATPSP